MNVLAWVKPAGARNFEGPLHTVQPRAPQAALEQPSPAAVQVLQDQCQLSLSGTNRGRAAGQAVHPKVLLQEPGQMVAISSRRQAVLGT